ncbi:hypothetical protein AXG93_939s1160 [Marchantia polymorpha subsp. ruderalis]|uniref:Uncharacterized protein n=1 Tax=Marchantia polymorpha subsp. ruderalis TaxID=1480154 RepID=A0A176VKW6_MARPO|nr:hypothetical protein AXG93_939s1160 [Marchantia polymorpha subsp. ruderalis]
MVPLKLPQIGLRTFQHELIAVRLDFLLWGFNWVCPDKIREWLRDKDQPTHGFRPHPERWEVSDWEQVLGRCAGEEGHLLFECESVNVSKEEEASFGALFKHNKSSKNGYKTRDYKDCLWKNVAVAFIQLLQPHRTTYITSWRVGRDARLHATTSTEDGGRTARSTSAAEAEVGRRGGAEPATRCCSSQSKADLPGAGSPTALDILAGSGATAAAAEATQPNSRESSGNFVATEIFNSEDDDDESSSKEQEEELCGELRSQHAEAELQLVEVEGDHRRATDRTREELAERVNRCLRGYTHWEVAAQERITLRGLEIRAAELMSGDSRSRRRVAKRLDAFLSRSRDAIANLEAEVTAVLRRLGLRSRADDWSGRELVRGSPSRRRHSR